MKRFFLKRWHSVPVASLVAVLLGLALIGSGVAGAFGFGFLSFSTVITLDEPLTVEYNLHSLYGGDSEWHSLGDEDSLTLERSPGDNFVMQLRINNYSDNALTVYTTYTTPKPLNINYFTFDGWPGRGGVDGSCAGGGNTYFWVTVTAHGNAPPGPYTINFVFDRS